uniref:Homeobox domain-containing protein n=1 Tax=Nelumbo nucifera TaxID=4432 RepID=A0A822ZLQ3_NELNU|nr:TPA_asm: hypothetical protein HUJ06_003913 [Nelumbo nucifera]
MEEEAAACDIGLSLGLGHRGEFVPRRNRQKPAAPAQFYACLFPSDQPKEEIIEEKVYVDRSGLKRIEEVDDHHNNNSTSNNSSSSHTTTNDDSNNKNKMRKKLRLTKEQSMLLEDSFKQNRTLNTAQKQELAEQLNLQPRQVEVWFQNRRARTKLKQTEIDCEFLKKCYQTLSDENRRLKKEIQELRSTNLNTSPFYIQLPKVATLAICPSCERIAKAGEGKNDA